MTKNADNAYGPVPATEPLALLLSEGLGPNETLLERLRLTAHWLLAEGTGDDATHQTLKEAIAEIQRLRAEAKNLAREYMDADIAWQDADADANNLRAALRDLANAADAVGVRHFDSDDLPPEVDALQFATAAARLALGPNV